MQRSMRLAATALLNQYSILDTRGYDIVVLYMQSDVEDPRSGVRGVNLGAPYFFYPPPPLHACSV